MARLLSAPLNRRSVLTALALIPAVPGVARAAGELRLIMVDEPGCGYCRKFNAEVGGSYGRTAEGQFAPLVRVRRKSADLRGFDPVIYTPTFLLVRRGEELGRITGYPGPEGFFSELDQLLAKAGFAPGVTTKPDRAQQT